MKSMFLDSWEPRAGPRVAPEFSKHRLRELRRFGSRCRGFRGSVLLGVPVAVVCPSLRVPPISHGTACVQVSPNLGADHVNNNPAVP